MRKLQGEKREFPGTEAKPPRPLVWLGKRLLALALASGAAGYAFHLFGTWLLGVIAIATPFVGWGLTVLQIQSNFGIGPVAKRTEYPTPNFTQRAIEHVAEQADIRRRFGR